MTIKDYYQLTKDNEYFFRFIKNIMNEMGITVKQLTDGICDESEWKNLISGGYLSKLMMNRLLDRLGCNGIRCDTLLFASEYDDWKLRMDIIFAISDGKIMQAEELLKNYVDRHQFHNNIDIMDCNEKIEYQFVIMMQVYIMLSEKEDDAEIINKLKMSVELTIPQGTEIKLDIEKNVILSVQELDILLEYYYYAMSVDAWKDNNAVNYYYERICIITDYIQSASWFNSLSKARIFPKAVCYEIKAYQIKLQLDNDNHNRLEDIIDKLSVYHRELSKYDDAIEMLHDGGRAYYLIELCDAMEKAIDRMKTLLSVDVYKGMKIDERKYTINKYRQMLQYIEDMTGVSRYTVSGMYMYFEPNVYRMEQIVAERRKLLGMTQTELAEGICTAKTIRRLELGQCRPHGYNLYAILDRLELYSEFVLDEIVSNSTKNMEILEKLYDAISRDEIEIAEKLLCILENKIDMTYTKNRQTVERIKLNFAYRKGKISRDDYVNGLKDIIGYSVKYANILKNTEMYLTDCEVVLLQNLQNVENDKDSLIHLYNSFSKYERAELHMHKTELFRTIYASYMGNGEDYDNSNRVFIDVIKINYRMKRMYNIARCIYGIWWNNDMQHKYSTQQSKDMLNICIAISDFTKEYDYKHFFLKKIGSISDIL